MGAVGNRIAHGYPGAVPSYADLLAATRAEIREVAPAEVALGEVQLLDVREPDELSEGGLPGAIAIPRGHLESRVEAALPDRAAPVVVYCAGGARSVFAARTLREQLLARYQAETPSVGRSAELTSAVGD